MLGVQAVFERLDLIEMKKFNMTAQQRALQVPIIRNKHEHQFTIFSAGPPRYDPYPSRHSEPKSEAPAKEKPTRTLFVRNISYDYSPDEIEQLFAKYGQIKKFFNLISKRGMAFITYVSILRQNHLNISYYHILSKLSKSHVTEMTTRQI